MTFWCAKCNTRHSGKCSEEYNKGYRECELHAVEAIERLEDAYCIRMAVIAIVCLAIGLAIGWFLQ